MLYVKMSNYCPTKSLPIFFNLHNWLMWSVRRSTINENDVSVSIGLGPYWELHNTLTQTTVMLMEVEREKRNALHLLRLWYESHWSWSSQLSNGLTLSMSRQKRYLYADATLETLAWIWFQLLFTKNEVKQINAFAKHGARNVIVVK